MDLDYGLTARSLADKYISSLYFAMMTITYVYSDGSRGMWWMTRIFRTVGYGDIAARTFAERWYVTFVMATSWTMAAFLFAHINAIIQGQLAEATALRVRHWTPTALDGMFAHAVVVAVTCAGAAQLFASIRATETDGG